VEEREKGETGNRGLLSSETLRKVRAWLEPYVIL
jgi:hypothetical protein